MSGRMPPPPPQLPTQGQHQPPMRLMAQHLHPQAHARPQGHVHPHSQVHTTHVHPPPHPQTAADLPLSITALMHVMRDAEHLTARYGSTSAACARLEELEHVHMDLQTQIATLQQKLSMAMVAAAAAQVDSHSSGSSASASADRERERDRPPTSSVFSADALLSFLQHHCACRGNLALLHAVLHDFQRSLVLPPDTRFQSRDVLVSVHEILPVSQDQTPVQVQQGGPVARKKTSHEMSRLTPKVKQPAGQSAMVSSPARSAGVATPPRAIAPAQRNSPIPVSVTSMALGTINGSNQQQQQLQQRPSDRRAQKEEKQTTTAAIMLSALSRPSSARSSSAAASAVGSSTENARLTAQAQPKTAVATVKPTLERKQSGRRSSSDSTASTKKRASSRLLDEDAPVDGDAGREEVGAQAQDEDEDKGPVNKRKRSSTASAVAEPNFKVVAKQNMSLPQDKRNIVELKQSSQLLTLEALEELTRRGPWDEVYKLRSTFSHILNYHALSEPARRWFISALRVQFVWRREFWERLHWLPMSDSICSGGEWEKYRQTRKRRANKAIAAWRKVYSDSLELMRNRLLPEDVWCDVALWYMPSTPLYWLPSSADLNKDLDLVDTKHPVRCYHVKDFTQHPFYSDHELQRKYPDTHELPSPQLLALQNENKASRVNFTPE